MPSLEEQLVALAAAPTDTLKHAAIPASFTKIPWATIDSGSMTEAEGWRPTSYAITAGNTRSGIYWNTEQMKAEAGTNKGAAALFQLRSQSAAVLRSFSAWLFINIVGTKINGYQVDAVYKEEKEGFHYYTMTLWRWVESVGVELASSVQPLEDGSGLIAITHVGGVVTAWNRFNNPSAFSKIGSATDNTFLQGFSGIAGNGSNPTFVNFATGPVVVGKELIVPRVPSKGLIMSGRRSQ